MSEHFLQPGEIHFSSIPKVITTILGSCIAVCLYDIEKKSGGMCHYYLPRAYHSEDPQSNKYGVVAILNLLKEFKKHGSQRENLRAKVIGGGHVLNSIDKTQRDVGGENIKVALELLEKYSIPIEGKKVGGFKGKKIRFHTESGLVQIKDIEKSQEQTPPSPAPTKKKQIKVMIVDDSKPVRHLLKKMIEENPELTVSALAENAMDAMKIIKKDPPDVLTLDIQMPGMSGIEFLKLFMPLHSIPTIMVSGFSATDFDPIMESLENGAFDFIKKPNFSDLENMKVDLHECIKEAFKAKRFHYRKYEANVNKEKITVASPLLNNHLIAIGASTGGTEALRELLIRLPENVPPIVIVQHIPPGFSKAFADRLNTLCSFKVKEAQNGDVLKPGNCYVAPGANHMRFVEKDGELIVRITQDPPVNRFRPSVDYMFNSVLDFTTKRKIAAVILTGMGDDGARGMKELFKKNVYTIAQDEESSVVYGMPKVAKEMGGVCSVISLLDIPKALAKFLNS